MALSKSNTFILPASTKSVAIARVDWNSSFFSMLQSFYSNAVPVALNIDDEGTTVNPPDGTLYRSRETGALYVADTLHTVGTGNPVYGDPWTRNGIGIRVEDNLAAVDITTYEIGELFGTVPSNARVYMKSTEAGLFVDIGIPPADSISNTMLKANSVTADKISDDFDINFQANDYITYQQLNANINVVQSNIVSNMNLVPFFTSNVSDGNSNVFLVIGPEPTVGNPANLHTIYVGGVFQSRTDWIYHAGNNSIQFTEAGAIPNGINVDIEALL